MRPKATLAQHMPDLRTIIQYQVTPVFVESDLSIRSILPLTVASARELERADCFDSPKCAREPAVWSRSRDYGAACHGWRIWRQRTRRVRGRSVRI